MTVGGTQRDSCPRLQHIHHIGIIGFFRRLQMNSWKSVFALGVSLILVVGCGPARPDGIPQLYPATVTVTNGGTPIERASVLLAGGPSGGSWIANGVTDVNGIAVITTSQGEWQGKGAPEGEYKVYIMKNPDIHQEPLPPELADDSQALERHGDEYRRLLAAAPRVIPEVLTSPATSPLTLTVSTSGTVELTVDVSQHQ